MLQSGIPFDTTKGIQRSYQLIEKVLDASLGSESAGRKLKEPETLNIEGEEGESVLKKTSRTLNKDSGKKIVHEIHVDGKK
jgi:hypothetical protein